MSKLGKKFSFPLPLFRRSNLGTVVCLLSSHWETANSQVDLEENQFQHSLIKSHFLAQAQHGCQPEHVLDMGHLPVATTQEISKLKHSLKYVKDQVQDCCLSQPTLQHCKLFPCPSWLHSTPTFYTICIHQPQVGAI